MSKKKNDDPDDIQEVMKQCSKCGMDLWAAPDQIDMIVRVHEGMCHEGE